jgi:hypothetical protein
MPPTSVTPRFEPLRSDRAPERSETLTRRARMRVWTASTLRDLVYCGAIFLWSIVAFTVLVRACYRERMSAASRPPARSRGPWSHRPSPPDRFSGAGRTGCGRRRARPIVGRAPRSTGSAARPECLRQAALREGGDVDGVERRDHEIRARGEE